MDPTLQSLWNNRFLMPPPVISLPAPLMETGKVKTVLKVLKEMQKDKDKWDVIMEEKFALCRIIYKLNSQLRSEKTLQILKRIKVCLSKLSEMKMEKTIGDYLHMLQESNLMSRAPYLPSRQMMEYLLIRVMGTRFLYRQTANFCSTAYVHLKQQLSIGTLVPQNLTLMALTSRIWVLMNVCSQSCVDWYNKIHTCLTIFPATALSWLPDGTVLPSTISELEDENESSLISASMDKRMERERFSRGRAPIIDAGDKTGVDTKNSSGHANSTVSSVNKIGVQKLQTHPDAASLGQGRSWSEVHGSMASGQLDSSEDEGETVSRSGPGHMIESHLRVSSEDEGEPVVRSELTDKSCPQESSEDEGQPVSRGDLLGYIGQHQSKKRKQVDDDDDDDEVGQNVSNPAITVASLKETRKEKEGGTCKLLDDEVIRNSSIEDLIHMLSDMDLTFSKEAQLVKLCIETLMKLKKGSAKKGQKKKLKQARKLVLNLSSELEQLKVNHQQNVKKEMKMQQGVNTKHLSRSRNDESELVETKAGGKRKLDQSVKELGFSSKKKKCKENPDSGNQKSANNKRGFLEMVKLWQKGVPKSYKVSVKGFKYDLSDNTKRRKFLKKLKILKLKYLKGEQSDEDSMNAIVSFLSSI